LLTNYWIDTKVYTLIQLAIWFFIININSNKSKIHGKFFIDKKQKNLEQIGQIFSVQSKRIFLAKLFEDKGCIEKFDIVEFKYAMESTSDVFIGIVFDVYLLNQEKWIKIIQVEKSTIVKKLEQNYIYKTTLESIKNIDNFIGFVTQGSEIGKIKFEYSKKKNDLQEGDLLQLKVEEKTIYYQVINGFTLKEKLENKNENGFIEGEAIQLGEWINDKCCFQKFGWLPFINTPIYRTDASDVEFEKLKYPYYQIGKIPGTQLPCVVNLDHAISHHLALLGVTGSGKSYLAREIIEEIKQDTKVICVDFNKEFILTLNPKPDSIISQDDEKSITKDINFCATEYEKFPNQQNKANIETAINDIKIKFNKSIERFICDDNKNNNNIKIFELPDVVNTSSIFEYTKYFFKTLFEIAKKYQIENKTNKTKKICIVLEEAHTIVPEWNFASSSEKTSQSVVNSIGQIALQGRKYGVGFIVIAQRTANVSKTILTQCNTVVCFQAFDETSFSFLGNYIGKDIVHALPNLKPFHAVVAGKGIKSNVPMIINLEREVKTEINLQTEDVYLNNDLKESSQFEYNIQEN